MNTYTNKYYITRAGNYKKVQGDGRQGRAADPDQWITGPDPVEHDKYYAWLKHRSQARFRGEEYNLTWQDWSRLWGLDKWLSRGRSSECYTMYRLNSTVPWHKDNVVICLVRDKGKYYQPDRPAGGRPKGKQ